MTACAETILTAAMRQHLLPPPRIGVDEWADTHRRSVVKSRHPGPWRNDLAPHIVQPMRDFVDPAIRSILLMFPPQTAKTELMLCILLYCIDTYGDDAMWVMDSEKQVADFSTSRVQKNILASPRVARHLSTRAWDTKTSSINFRTGMTLWLAGAGSTGRLSNKPIRWGFFDEIDKWREAMRSGGRQEGKALELARARLTSWGELAREVIASTPTLENTGIHAEFLRTPQCRRWYPCPHCGRHQRLEFRRIRWEGGDGSGLPEGEHAEHSLRVERGAWYECAHCQKRIENHHRPAMLRSGLYIEHHQEITRSGLVGPAPLETDRRGYACGLFDVLGHPWGAVARAFVDRRGLIDQDFINKYLGEPWREPGSGADIEKLRPIVIESQRLQESTEAGAYRAGQVPEGTLLLLGSFDGQQDHAHLRVHGFAAPPSDAARQRHSAMQYLIDEWTVPWPASTATAGEAVDDPDMARRLTADTRCAVLEAVRRRYETVGGVDFGEVDWWAFDSGHRTGEVYDLCKVIGPHAIPVKGADQQSSFIVPTQAVARLAPGKRRTADLDGLTLLLLHTLHWKNVAYRILTDPEVMRWPIEYDPEHPEALTETFRRRQALLLELISEYKVRIKTKTGADKGERWVKKPGQTHNHQWDLMYYLQAIFWHLTGGHADWHARVRRRSEERPPARRRGLRAGRLPRG